MTTIINLSEVCVGCQHIYGDHSQGISGPCYSQACECPHFNYRATPVDDSEEASW